MRRLGTIQIVALIAVAVVMRLLYTHRKIQAPRPQSIPSNTAGNGQVKRTSVNANGEVSAWDSRDCVVIGLAVGYGLSNFEQFVGSLRATGYNGHIIIGIGENPPSGVVEYLTKRQVTIKVVKFTQCTFTNYTTNTGQLSPFNQRQKCAVGYPDYKIQWGRFPLAADWLRECTGCTGGVMLTDVRDVFFQRDPFAAVVTPHPIMVFEEHPMLTTEYWLVGYIVKQCKGSNMGKRPMLCSGSTMGTRDGILDYIAAMVKEFDIWLSQAKCRFDIIGDDQSIHDYLFYEGKLPNAVMIPYRTGPIHIVGGPADKIFRAAIEVAKKDGHDEGWVNAHRFYGTEDKWEQWLDPKFNLTDDKGYITNFDGTPSPQVHQYDRFGRPFDRWLNRRVKEWNAQLDAAN